METDLDKEFEVAKKAHIAQTCYLYELLNVREELEKSKGINIQSIEKPWLPVFTRSRSRSGQNGRSSAQPARCPKYRGRNLPVGLSNMVQFPTGPSFLKVEML